MKMMSMAPLLLAGMFVASCTVTTKIPVKAPLEIPAKATPEIPFEAPLENPAKAPPEIPVEVSPEKNPEVQSALACDIMPAIEWMDSQTIKYTQNPSDEWRDCSGNFLRLSSRIASLCPSAELVAPPGITRYSPEGNNKRPGVEQARTTRGVAAWYNERGMFEPIFYDGVTLTEAPAALRVVRNRIQPGSVLWFSRKKPLEVNGSEGLYKEAGGAINHMGTVVTVVKDENGNVTEWTMYHGQNTKSNNGITRHWWDWPKKYTLSGKQYPPGGYWTQRIVGFSESLIPSNSLASAN